MPRSLLAMAFVAAACAAPEDLPGDARDGDASRTDADTAPDRDDGTDTEPDSFAEADAEADGTSPDETPFDDGARDDAVDDGARDDVVDDGARDDAVDDGAPDSGSLDPDLSLPDASGTPCTTPGSMGECPGIAVCRFFTPTEGRCESCDICGNLGDYCSASDECDILFMCYAGVCTNICPLDTYYCGPVEDCLDIGHPTYGVCRP